ncbi:elongation factor 1-alpha, putative [Entamoeba invadens IP1]|uniref:Elongation factor 1-alpha, putative n=1 Tax=Entamoeba invadens IP1 TaxID=370355 RepID=L7FPT4_ENTIV|nr:elongation factor 1-alpha, putative [Entamoeba invadens IP1]ELP91969.1 elongation factor 1-alpha, putative [Entamoeba invadens IP1]|eukprot:XP_004258740.1 elongation factor 1-alpha, putative [Entamoeba invadens IP1]
MFIPKDHVNVVVVGPFQSGKSTFLGHLFVDLKQVDQRTIDRYKRDCIEFLKPNCEYAYVFEKTKIEHEIGLTNIQATKGIFAKDILHPKEELCNSEIQQVSIKKYEKMNVSFIDTPGRKKYIKNAIRGIHKGDVAFLVICASLNFEDQKESIIENLIPLKIFLVELVAVIVTKMGEVKYSEVCFEETKQKIIELMKIIGLSTESVRFVPIDGLEGDNLTVYSDKMAWTVNKYGTVVDLLNTLIIPERNQLDTQPFGMTIENICKIRNVGTVLVGIVESGVVHANQIVTVSPSGLSVKTKSVETMGNPILEGKGRVLVGVNVVGATDFDYKIG